MLLLKWYATPRNKEVMRVAKLPGVCGEMKFSKWDCGLLGFQNSTFLLVDLCIIITAHNTDTSLQYLGARGVTEFRKSEIQIVGIDLELSNTPTSYSFKRKTMKI